MRALKRNGACLRAPPSAYARPIRRRSDGQRTPATRWTPPNGARDALHCWLYESRKVSQMVCYARNKPLEIKMTCPNCRFVTRYDESYLEDAIKYHKWIWCVACDKPFRIVFQVLARDAEQRNGAERAGANGLQTCP